MELISNYTINAKLNSNSTPFNWRNENVIIVIEEEFSSLGGNNVTVGLFPSSFEFDFY